MRGIKWYWRAGLLVCLMILVTLSVGFGKREPNAKELAKKAVTREELFIAFGKAKDENEMHLMVDLVRRLVDSATTYDEFAGGRRAEYDVRFSGATADSLWTKATLGMMRTATSVDEIGAAYNGNADVVLSPLFVRRSSELGINGFTEWYRLWNVAYGDSIASAIIVDSLMANAEQWNDWVQILERARDGSVSKKRSIDGIIRTAGTFSELLRTFNEASMGQKKILASRLERRAKTTGDWMELYDHPWHADMKQTALLHLTTASTDIDELLWAYDHTVDEPLSLGVIQEVARRTSTLSEWHHIYVGTREGRALHDIAAIRLSQLTS